MADEIKKCKSCDAEIIFRKTTNGKWIPCDPEEITIVTDKGYVNKGWVSHFATCPFADQHRKEK